jgi:hypothetical protein
LSVSILSTPPRARNASAASPGPQLPALLPRSLGASPVSGAVGSGSGGLNRGAGKSPGCSPVGGGGGARSAHHSRVSSSSSMTSMAWPSTATVTTPASTASVLPAVSSSATAPALAPLSASLPAVSNPGSSSSRLVSSRARRETSMTGAEWAEAAAAAAAAAATAAATPRSPS